MTRVLVVAVLVVSCWGLDLAAQAKPVPVQELSASVDRRDIKMSWRPSQPESGVRYYVDICRFERGNWLRIFGAYVGQSPFSFERPSPGAIYAWRVLSVDAGNERSFAPTPWQIVRTPVPSR